MGPDRLNAFTVCHADIVHESKVEGSLTRLSMTDQMEFRNGNAEGIESSEIKWGDGWISGQATLEVFPPLTSNIIGNHNISDSCLHAVLEGRHHSIVNVDESEADDQNQ